MSDTANQPDLTDPAVLASLGLEERTEGGPPEAPESPEPRLNPNIRQALGRLGETARERDEANARASQLERELAIERAGLPESPMRELFLKAYEGPATAEAIRAEAERYGLLQPEGQPAEDEPQTPSVTEAELDQHRAVAAASKGATTSGDIPLEQALLSATSPEEVLRIVSEAPPEARVQAAPRTA